MTLLRRLEAELSLSYGNGVNYIGNKVKVDDEIATLFVGLGTSGVHMLLRTKKEIKKR